MNYETNAASRRTTYGAALALVLAAAPAMAGSDAKIAIEEPPANNGDWCTWLKSKPGTIYKNKENSIIQEVGFFGRLQYQQSWIDGESGGNDFWYDSEGEFRRLRIGAYVKFLDLFQLKANADMARDSRPKGGSLHLSYQNLYEAQLTFNAQKAFNIASHSKFTLGFGKSKIKLSSESIASSKKIKTIERSAIANKLLPTNLTGFWLDAQTGKISYYLGVFSTVRHNEIAGWDMGRLYTGRLGYDFTSSKGYFCIIIFYFPLSKFS
ncbi:MAG: porin [Akkermansiaceae bacterium]